MIAFTLVFGLAYPLAMTGISQVVFPGKADGSKVTVNGRLVGSSLIGQDFKGNAGYFQPRPSQTGYAADATYFTNSGPNSVEEREAVREEPRRLPQAGEALRQLADQGRRAGRRGDRCRAPASTPKSPRPTRGSRRTGSPPSAACRSARSKSLISAHTDGRFLGVFGEPGVNVLQLNIALDEEAPIK